MKNLKYLREKNGLTQQQMANILNIQRPTYTRYENGERQPDFSLLLEMAGFFNVSVDYLLGRTENEAELSNVENDIEKILENTFNGMENKNGLMFDGVPATQEDIEQIKFAMRIGMAMAKEKSKEKYKK